MNFHCRDNLVSGQLQPITFIGPPGTALVGCHCESPTPSLRPRPFIPVPPFSPASTFLPHCCPRPALVTTHTLGTHSWQPSCPQRQTLTLGVKIQQVASPWIGCQGRREKHTGILESLGQVVKLTRLLPCGLGVLCPKNVVSRGQLGTWHVHSLGCPTPGRQGGA